MLSVLISIAALGLIGLALIGLSFLVSSVREREAKATSFAALQSAAMLILVLVFFFLLWAGFFETAPGIILLMGGIAAGAVAGFLLLRRSGANPRALQGTRGLIVGEVKRWDEREIVFARNRYLQPDTERVQGILQRAPGVGEERREEKGERRAAGSDGSDRPVPMRARTERPCWRPDCWRCSSPLPTR